MCFPARSLEMASEQDPKGLFDAIANEHFSANSFLKIRNLLQNQKRILTALQPFNRSLSQPELRADLAADFKTFRDLLLNHNKPPQHENGINCCTCSQGNSSTRLGYEVLDEESDQSAPPVPKPRKSVLQRRRQTKDSRKETSPPSDTQTSIRILPSPKEEEAATQAVSDATAANPQLPQVPDALSPKVDTAIGPGTGSARLEPNVSLFIATEQATVLPCQLSHSSRAETIRVKAKHSFRQFLKINKIASNKFLSIRLSKDGLSRKKLFSWHTEAEPYKPRRPTRLPPPPPILIFRTPAPPPESDSDEEQVESKESSNGPAGKAEVGEYSQSNANKESFEGDDISELYHDAFNAEDLSESIYCSVDEVNTTEPDERVRAIGKSLYQIVDELWREGDADDATLYDETKDEDYYEDGECIYEEVSSNEGTIYEEFIEEENVYDNAEVALNGSKADDEKKQIKRLKKMQKIMKRFHLNGDEIPVNAGIIKRDQKGSRSELMVRQGETVLILRIEKCPPGKWLAKNERSKIGYVDLDNVYFDTESIKTVIKGFHNI